MIGYARALRRNDVLLEQRSRLVDLGVRVVHEDLRGGGTVLRPALGYAVRELVPGVALCVTSLDRIARSHRDIFGFALMLKHQQAHLVALDDGIDTRTDDGAFFAFAAAMLRHEDRANEDRLLEAGVADLPLSPGPPASISETAWAEVYPLIVAKVITKEGAAARLGVSRATVYRHLRRDRPKP